MILVVGVNVVDFLLVPGELGHGTEPLRAPRTDDEQPRAFPNATRFTLGGLESFPSLFPSLLARAWTFVGLLPNDAAPPMTVDDDRRFEVGRNAHAVHVVEDAGVGRPAAHAHAPAARIAPAALKLILDDRSLDFGDQHSRADIGLAGLPA